MSNENVRKVSVLNKIRSVFGRIMQRAELPIRLAVKYFAFLFLFRAISGAEMFASLEQTGFFANPMFHMVLAVLATILPNRCGVFIAFALVTYNVFQTSLIGAALVGLMLILLYVIASSLFPDYVYLIVLVPVCIQYHWFLAVPLAAGMYLGIGAAVPVVIGVLVYGFWGIIPPFMELQMDGSLDGIPKLIGEASENGLNAMMSNESLTYLMVIFTAIILVTALLRMLHVNYSRYIALGIGSILGLVGLMVGAAHGNISGVSIAWNSIIVILVLVFLELFKVPLSYKSAQVLEFEDDEFMYKVRMIPKMSDRSNIPPMKPVITSVAERKAQRQQRRNLRGQAMEQAGPVVPPVAPVAAVPVEPQLQAPVYPSQDTMVAPYGDNSYAENTYVDNSYADNTYVVPYVENTAAETPVNGPLDLTLAPGEVQNYSGDLSAYGIKVENGVNVGVAPTIAATTVAAAPSVAAAPANTGSVILDDDVPTDLFSDYDNNRP